MLKALLASFLCAGALVAGAQAADLDEIKARGTLRVAVAPLSPFVIKDKDGALSGFEIDATTALGEELGVAVEYVERPFCELIDTVLNGEADMIASGFSNMPERRNVLGFSLPYHDTEYYLVLSRPKSKLAKTLRGVNRKDIAVGYQHGGVSGMVARGEFPGAELKGFSSFAAILDALKKGDIDGAVMFDPYIDLAKKIKNRDLSVGHKYALTRTIEAYATEPGAEALREALNAFVIERDLEDFWDDLEEKWFSDAYAVASAPPPHACVADQPVQ